MCVSGVSLDSLEGLQICLSHPQVLIGSPFVWRLALSKLLLPCLERLMLRAPTLSSKPKLEQLTVLRTRAAEVLLETFGEQSEILAGKLIEIYKNMNEICAFLMYHLILCICI